MSCLIFNPFINKETIYSNKNNRNQEISNKKKRKINLFGKKSYSEDEELLINNLNGNHSSNSNNPIESIELIDFSNIDESKKDIKIKEKKKINFKKKECWPSFIIKVDNYVSTFQETDNIEKDLIKLNEDIYKLAVEEFGYKKKQINKNSPIIITKREKIIMKHKDGKCGIVKRNTVDLDIQISDYFQNINSINSNNKNVCNTRKYKWNKLFKNFDYSNFIESDFRYILDNRTNKNSDYNGLSFEVIKKSEKLLKLVLKYFNKIYYLKELPSFFKQCYMYETYKGKGDKKDIKNYRCITRFDTFSKLYWHLIGYKITKHSDKYNIIDKQIQKAFQEKISGTEENLFIYQEVKKESYQTIFLDMKNAYGSVNSKFMGKVLKYYGFPNTIVRQISNFILERKVIYGKEVRNWNTGLSQGLGVSNTLFILCMNYIIKDFNKKYSKKYGVKIDDNTFFVQMYADDIVIFLNKNYSSFQKVLNKLIKNFKNVGLSVNHTKCVVDNNKSNNDLYINSTKINKLEDNPEFKYLGQYANEKDIWKRFSEKLKKDLDNIKSEVNEIIENPTWKDYWNIYINIWKFKINWFMRVHNNVITNGEKIDTVEKNWFNSINGLSSKANDEDSFKNRKINAAITRHHILSRSIDTRIVNLYKKSMGSEYKKIEEHYKNKFNNKLIYNTGFKKTNVYV